MTAPTEAAALPFGADAILEVTPEFAAAHGILYRCGHRAFDTADCEGLTYRSEPCPVCRRNATLLARAVELDRPAWLVAS